MTKVLILTGDPIGAKMAGPAIRSWNMALQLSQENEVILVTTTVLEEIAAPFGLRRVKPGENRAFAELERWADVIVFQGHAMNQFEALRHTSKIVVVDIYDPMHLEMLEQGRELPFATWELRVSTATSVLNQQLTLGDFFLCSSERQRLFYLGQLAALGRINPKTYQNDPHMRSLIAVAPFGLSAEPPLHRKPALRGVVPGIGTEDKVLIWGGGVYNWFDPKTLISAVAELVSRRDNVRLFFLGTRHPGVEEMGIVRESVDLARELGVLDSAVFFNEDWVDFAERANYLTEADAGVSTHHSHIETTFSFRTRILDYLWAGLPMVVTEGDTFAELVEHEGLGIVVPAGDSVVLAAALESILFDDQLVASFRANVERVAADFQWEMTLSSVVKFVKNPHHAADFTGSRNDSRSRPFGVRKPHGVRHDLSMTWHYFKHSGPRATLTKLRNRLRRRR
ncbi:MAG TPA: glycosyltransferase family 4 protein [Terrimesophilobacter sp.]|nr:glycosyltransferase family 4 protein [Terrimesophilobacter sp.]